MFHGLGLECIITYLLMFPGSIIVELLFFRSEFWKKTYKEFSEWES